MPKRETLPPPGVAQNVSWASRAWPSRLTAIRARSWFGACAVCALAMLLAGPALADTFTSNGVKINYQVQGQGEPVVLVHGWLSSGWINWELPGIAKELAVDHQVVWLDMPGHGSSDKPAREDAYGVELVEHVARLLNHLKIKRAHLVGYSMGGVIAAQFAVRHPDRTHSLTLGGMGWLREGSVEQRVFAAGGGDGKPAGLCFRSLAKLALTEEQVKSIRVPVQILFGENDWLKKGYVEPLQKVRKDWKVIDIQGANHLTCLAKPEFKRHVHDWINEHAARPSAGRNSTSRPARE